MMSRTPEQAANGCAWMVYIPIVLSAWFFEDVQILRWLLFIFAYVCSSWLAQYKIRHMRAIDKPMIVHSYPILISWTPFAHSIWASLVHLLLLYWALLEPTM
jgi:hypothetical protein